jgi:hypothetical protein
MGLRATVELRRNGGRRSGLAIDGRLFSFQHKPLPNAIHGVDMHLKGFSNLRPHQTTARSAAIAQQQNLSVANLLDGPLSVTRNLQQALTLLGRQNNRLLIWRRNPHPMSLLAQLSQTFQIQNRQRLTQLLKFE